jgi:hypothetical protein
MEASNGFSDANALEFFLSSNLAGNAPQDWEPERVGPEPSLQWLYCPIGRRTPID